MSARRRALTLAVSAFLAEVGSSSPGRAEDDKAACVAAHVAGQAAEKSGALRAAVEQFARCARSTCPPVVQSECESLGAASLAALPSLTVAATNGGATLEPAAVRLFVDGELVAESLERPIVVDPGEHALRFEHADGRFVEQRITAVRREKMRRLTVDFPRAAAARPPAPLPPEPPALGPPPRGEARPVPILVPILGAVGLAGLGTFGAFALLGKEQEDDLRPCAPACRHDDVSTMYDRYLVADVALGASVLALGAAAVLWLTRPAR